MYRVPNEWATTANRSVGRGEGGEWGRGRAGKAPAWSPLTGVGRLLGHDGVQRLNDLGHGGVARGAHGSDGEVGEFGDNERAVACVGPAHEGAEQRQVEALAQAEAMQEEHGGGVAVRASGWGGVEPAEVERGGGTVAHCGSCGLRPAVRGGHPVAQAAEAAALEPHEAQAPGEGGAEDLGAEHEGEGAGPVV